MFPSAALIPPLKQLSFREISVEELYRTYLRSNSMTSRGEKLGDTRRAETSLCKSKGSSQTSSSCTTFWNGGQLKEENYTRDKTYTTIASYSWSINGYFPEAQDCKPYN
jgi:hypothetical protein